MATNRRKVAQRGPDFYPTPAWATQALLRYEQFESVIAEFCCGEGDISEILLAAGYTVYSADLHDRGYGYVRDALRERRRVSNIVTNPPFNIANQLVPHFQTLFKRKMCLLLRTAFLEGAFRYNAIFSRYPPQRIYVFSERLSMYPRGQPATGGGTTSYSWFVWDKQATNRVPRVYWIKPGHKPNTRYKNEYTSSRD